MTNRDRRTLADMLLTQARAFRAGGAADLARGLRARADTVVEGLYCALDVSAAPQPRRIPVRVRSDR